MSEPERAPAQPATTPEKPFKGMVIEVKNRSFGLDFQLKFFPGTRITFEQAKALLQKENIHFEDILEGNPPIVTGTRILADQYKNDVAKFKALGGMVIRPNYMQPQERESETPYYPLYVPWKEEHSLIHVFKFSSQTERRKKVTDSMENELKELGVDYTRNGKDDLIVTGKNSLIVLTCSGVEIQPVRLVDQYIDEYENFQRDNGRSR